MPTSYPLDLTGNAGTNLITNELHTFNIAADRIFPLTAGPFYTIGLEVYHGVTNQLLQPVTQYKALHLHRDASLVSGKEVCAVIIVEDATIPSVRVKYQCIGGLYSNEASLIQDLIDNNPIANDDVVWGQIIGIPVQFPPTEHLHHFDNIYGAEEMVAVLERIRMAIAAGDSPAISAIYQYIHTLLTNLNYTTEQDVIDLIGDDPVQYVKTYDTYADLRAETNVINNESYLYVATGKAARNDRKGRIFMWDIASTADDDNDTVLRPHPIPPTSPGRFVSMLGVETELRDALATIGRKIDASGNILTKLDDIFTLDAFDLDMAVNSGLFFVKSNCTNKPTGNTQGHLFVEKSATHIVQHYISTVQDDRNMVSEDYTNISVPTAHVFNRVGHLVTDIYVWEEWRCLIDRHTLNYLLKTLGRKIEDDFTINTNISSFITPLTGSTNLNDIVKPGIYPLMADADNSTPHSNWPLGVYRGIMIVESTYLGGVSTEFHTFQEIITSYDNDEQGDPVGQNPFLDGTIKPTVYRRVKENNSWTGWFKTLDSQDALRHGLTTQGIAATNTVPALTNGNPTDLDAYTMPGKYWVGTGIVNSAFEWGLLEVELIGGTATESGEVIQTMRSPQNNGRYSQRMRYWDAPFSQYVWSDWITLANELDLKNALATLGRRIEPDGRINGDLAEIKHTESADLNTVIISGVYWTDSNNPNSPADFGSGVMYVERANENYVFQRIHGGFAEVGISDNTETRTNYTIHMRCGNRANNTLPITWSRWESTLTARRGFVNGIDAHLAETNVAGVDINTHGRTGIHWVHSSANAPFSYAVLEVYALGATDTIQTIWNTRNRAVRYGSNGTNYSGHTWSEWVFSQHSDLAITGSTEADFNSLTHAGKYWFGITNANRPEYSPGIYMDYGQLEVVSLSSSDVMQHAFNTGGEAYRYGYNGTNYSGHTWSPWVFRALRNGEGSEVFENATPAVGTELGTHSVNIAMQNIAFQTLWNVLHKYGIEYAIAGANPLGSEVDLNTVTEPGKYWIGDSQANRPFNWGILDVELVGGTIASPAYVLHTARWDGRVATRSMNYLGVWSDWRFIKNKDIRNERHLISEDLDTIIEDDNYACTTCTNAPETNGILTVKRETSVLIYQTFHSRTNTVYTRTTSDGGVTWTLWRALGTATKEINIGVVIRYYGQQSFIMPCFIGEKEVSGYTNTDVDVFISGEYKTISLNNIQPLMPSLITGPTKQYIYLVEESAGVYVLEAAAQKPTFIPQDSSVFPRKPMFFPGTVQATSNKLFIGMCLIENSHYIVTRSWFKDPGFMEHYQSYYTRPDDLEFPHLITERVSGGVKKLNIPSALHAISSPGASQIFTYLSDPPVFPEDLTPAIPLLAWGGETVRLSYTLSVVLDSTSENYARGRIFIKDDETVYDSQLYQIPYIECRSSVISRNAINAYANSEFFTVSGETANVKPHDHGIAIRLYGQIHDAGSVFKIGSTDQLNGFSEIVLTLCSVQTFRSLLIHTVSAAMWFTGPRVITLPATTLFDLNLKTYHDMIYGGAAPANSSVEFIVPNGCLVTASTTSLYAITNPNSWASGVTTKIKVEAGGFIAGRGGDGGRGGRAIAQYVDSDGDGFTTYYGGNASDPSSVIHGKKGGNAIRTFRALVVENLGFIGVGSGGGGASGGGVIGYSSTEIGGVDVNRIAVSGNGGGGGWPLGLGGGGGQIRLDDSSQAEYHQNEGGGGNNAWHVSGNPGENAGGYGSHTTPASGGAPISRTNGNSVLSHGAGGGGGLSALAQYSAGGGGSSWTNVSWVYVGDAGTGGNEGDYAINATGGSVTYVGPSGDIRGSVI